MNAKQELLAKYEAWVDQGKQLKEQIDALPDDKPVPAGRWKPGIGEDYFLIFGFGIIGRDVWQNDIDDKRLYELDGVYRTEEEVQAALDQQLATVRVLDRIAELNAEQGWVCDWGNGGQDKYFLGFGNVSKELQIDLINIYQAQPTTYYGSKQTIETVIKEMESDCLLMLGVSGGSW